MATKIGVIADGNAGGALAGSLAQDADCDRLGGRPLTAFVAADDAAVEQTTWRAS